MSRARTSIPRHRHRTSVGVVALGLALLGLLAMHGLSGHGTAGHAGSSHSAVSTRDVASDALHALHARHAEPEPAVTLGLAPVDVPGGGPAGAAAVAVLCLAVLAASVLRWMARRTHQGLLLPRAVLLRAPPPRRSGRGYRDPPSIDMLCILRT